MFRCYREPYIRHPSEVTSIDNQITRLQRNTGEEQQKLADLNDPYKAVRGFANLARESPEAFVQQYETSAFDTLKSVGANLKGKSDIEVASLLSAAMGSRVNARDLRTLGAMNNPDLLTAMTGAATTALADPNLTGLGGRYGTIRDTRSQEIGSTRQAVTNRVANDADAVDKAVSQTGIFDVVKKVADAFASLPQPIQDVSALLAIMAGPNILKKLIEGFGSKAPPVPTGPQQLKLPEPPPLATAVESAPAAAVVALAASAAVLPAAAIKLGADNPDLVNYVAMHPEGSSEGGAPPAIVVNVGGVQITGQNGDGPTLQQILDAVTQQITVAWSQAQNAPSRQLGGAHPY